MTMENKKSQDRSLSISETCKPLLKKSKILFLKKDENENYRNIKNLSKFQKIITSISCVSSSKVIWKVYAYKT